MTIGFTAQDGKDTSVDILLNAVSGCEARRLGMQYGKEQQSAGNGHRVIAVMYEGPA